MATLEKSHPGMMHWLSDLFRAPSRHMDLSARNGWMPWWWGIGISPEPLAGPFWMPPAHRVRHRPHPHPHHSAHRHPRPHA